MYRVRPVSKIKQGKNKGIIKWRVKGELKGSQNKKEETIGKHVPYCISGKNEKNDKTMIKVRILCLSVPYPGTVFIATVLIF
jgi:hypothetical protein